MISGLFATRVFAWLTTLFNALALNLVMIVASLPLITAPAAIIAAEVRYFAGEVTPAGRAGLALGAAALLITLAALGYVFQLTAAQPGLSPVELWSRSARLAVRNLLIAGPLSAVPVAGLVVLTVRDPFVLLLGLPIFLLQALKLIARTTTRP